jgi:cell division protein FtsL
MAYAVRRPVENVYLVRERDRKRTRELAALALAAVPPLLVLLAAIWANLETVRLGYQLATVGRQREALLERNRQLRMDRAQATSLSRVDEIARRALGLVSPAPEQILLIQDSALGAPVVLAPPRRPAPMIPATRPVSSEGGF